MNNESQYNPEKWSKEINLEILKILKNKGKTITKSRGSFSISFNNIFSVGYCKKCKQTFSSNVEFYDHVLSNHGMHMCPRCSKLHNIKTVEHYLRTNGNYYCDICQTGFIEYEY